MQKTVRPVLCSVISLEKKSDKSVSQSLKKNCLLKRLNYRLAAIHRQGETGSFGFITVSSRILVTGRKATADCHNSIPNTTKYFEFEKGLVY